MTDRARIIALWVVVAVLALLVLLAPRGSSEPARPIVAHRVVPVVVPVAAAAVPAAAVATGDDAGIVAQIAARAARRAVRSLGRHDRVAY